MNGDTLKADRPQGELCICHDCTTGTSTRQGVAYCDTCGRVKPGYLSIWRRAEALEAELAALRAQLEEQGKALEQATRVGMVRMQTNGEITQAGAYNHYDQAAVPELAAYLRTRAALKEGE